MYLNKNYILNFISLMAKDFRKQDIEEIGENLKLKLLVYTIGNYKIKKIHHYSLFKNLN